MRPLVAGKHPRLYAVLLALGLILLALQQISTQSTMTNQHHALQIHQHNQQQATPAESGHCTADCISTLQHCCLYALSPNQPLSVFIFSSVPSSALVYFFNSRAITPQTPPPKAA
ncbi:MAG TPA: hypothetical protein GX719_07665 [Gammaproteobacteria bacterium]|nr:hypothetical protein [Gammaproteobacteria bacterium]